MAASSQVLSAADWVSPVERTVKVVGVSRRGRGMLKGVEGQVVRVEVFWNGWRAGGVDRSREERGVESGREGVRGVQVVTCVRAKIVQMDAHESALVGRSIANGLRAKLTCRYSGCRLGLRISFGRHGAHDIRACQATQSREIISRHT